MNTVLDKLKSFFVVVLCMIFGASMVYAMVSYATVMKLEPVKQIDKVEQDGAVTIGEDAHYPKMPIGASQQGLDAAPPIRQEANMSSEIPYLTAQNSMPMMNEDGTHTHVLRGAEKIFADLKRTLKEQERIIAELRADNQRLRGE